MQVSEYDRHQLLVWFEERMGPEQAAAMMNRTPPIVFDVVKLEAMRSATLRTAGTGLFASQGAVSTAIGVFGGLG